MADTKITALTALTAADPANDVLPIVDVSDTTMAASGTTKKISVNNILGCSGTATLASATITGDLTVDTSTLKVDSANNRVGIGTASPAYLLDIADASFATRFVATNTNNSAFGAGVYLKTLNGASMVSNATLATSNDGTFNLLTGTSADSTKLSIGPTGIFTFQNVGGVAGTAMTLNSTGLGIGVSPSNNLHVQGASGATAIRISAVTDGTLGFIGSASGLISGSPANNLAVRAENGLYLSGGGNATQFILNSSGNVGIGVTPSALLHVQKSQNSETTAIINNTNTGTSAGVRLDLQSNGSNYLTLQSFGQNYSGNAFGISAAKLNVVSENSATAFSSGLAIGTTSSNPLYFATSNAVKMTLDASGNLLVGTTSGSNSRVVKAVAAGTTVLEVTGAAGYGSYFQSGDAQGSSSALSIANIGKVVSTGRSINAGGTINASGADYAEYMTKASDFVLAKGDIAGIDTNGKLTNVFADAVSFVVKSTDPSYVGNDKWGVDLEGDALEAARQLVDRIAFAGQVPVNVTGAKAGDYIVPVVDGTGIKGIAVSNPTFEQYQLAVGKVIAIDADGRARIIVKVA